MRCLPVVIASPLLFALGACDPAGGEGAGPAGGKADDLGSGSGVELDCNVVQVLDDNVLEEGLGAIYDYDREGFPFFDSDATRVAYRFSDSSELPDQRILSIGQISFGLHSADDTVREVEDIPEFADTEYFTVEAQLADDDLRFKVRIFEANMLGYVTYFAADPDGCFSREQAQCELTCAGLDCGCDELAEEECTGEHDLARIDCRGFEQPDFSGI